jgi:hypothetical protein
VAAGRFLDDVRELAIRLMLDAFAWQAAPHVSVFAHLY